MKLLLERSSYINAEQEIDYNALPNDKEKKKFIKNWLHGNGYRDSLAASDDFVIDVILRDGWDESENKFLTYIDNITRSENAPKLYTPELEIIYNLLSDDKLDPKAEWLYNPSLYSDKKENNIYKIQALTYASNPKLQAGANRRVKVADFVDKNNNIIPVDAIKDKLSKITLRQDDVKKQSKKAKRSMDERDPRILDAKEALKQLGLNQKQIKAALNSIKILKSDKAEDIVQKTLRASAQAKSKID